MVSVSLSGAILTPILTQFALTKLLDSLFEHLSKDVDNKLLQQLENELEAFKEAVAKLDIIQSEVRRLFERDKENKRLIHINKQLGDVSRQIEDFKDAWEYMEGKRKVEINRRDEVADNSPLIIRELRSWISRMTGGSSDKRRRLSSCESIDDIVNKMRTITEQINCIDSEVNNAIKLDAWSKIEIALKGGYQLAENKRVTTSSPTHESKSRENEFLQLMGLLIEPNVSDKVCVVTIDGMGDIGQTNLAQRVFNSQEIANHFEKKAWIWISDYFDRFRITKEILDSVSIGDNSSPTVPFNVTTSLDVLQREIKRRVEGKKFLLVLDNVQSEEWQELSDFLQRTQAEAIKLLVTCKDPKILGVSADGRIKITLEN